MEEDILSPVVEMVEESHDWLNSLKNQNPLSLEAFFLDELSREVGYETDEDAILEELPSEHDPVQKGRPRRRNDLFMEEKLPAMTRRDYRTSYRMDRTTIDTLVDILGERGTDGGRAACGVCPTPRVKQVLLTLAYLGGTKTIRNLSAEFDMSMASAFAFVDEVVERLANMREVFIRLPVGQQMLDTMRGFECICGVRGVLGAIGDRHIPIRKPAEHADQFSTGARGFYSCHLMTVCDADGRITDLNAGWPGGMHPAEVLDRSALSAQFSRQKVLEIYMPSECFLVGGSALPLRPWLMTPFRSVTDGRQATDGRKQHCNELLWQTRDVHRRTMALLRARFRRLTFVDTKSMKKAVLMICAICVLHNICLTLGDTWTDDDGVEDTGAEEEEEDGRPLPGGSLAPAGAHRRRNRLSHELEGAERKRTKREMYLDYGNDEAQAATGF